MEYTITPPSLSAFLALFKIFNCLSAQLFTCSSLHSLSAVESFLNIPSPLQGASTSTLSKQPASLSQSTSGYAFETVAFLIPILSIFESRILALFLTISLLHKKPFELSFAAICVLLPPGAAQRSST